MLVWLKCVAICKDKNMAAWYFAACQCVKKTINATKHKPLVRQ